MLWIIEDFKRALLQLKRWQTWATIGLIGIFALLAYLVGRLALKTDTVLTYLRATTHSCRDFSNGVIIFLFCGMIFFLFTAVVTLGEVQRYFQFRQRGATRQARQALVWGCGGGFVAVSIAISALILFNKYCR